MIDIKFEFETNMGRMIHRTARNTYFFTLNIIHSGFEFFFLRIN